MMNFIKRNSFIRKMEALQKFISIVVTTWIAMEMIIINLLL